MYLGIDASTSCSGFAVIDDNNKLCYHNYVFSKPKLTGLSFGQKFSVLNDLFYQELSAIKNKFPILKKMSLEANSFGNFQTTMQLGIVIGLIHSIVKTLWKDIEISYCSASNWRNKILDLDPLAIDLKNKAERDQLKIAIMDWAERNYQFSLPIYESKYLGVKKQNGDWDPRINDVSDAIGLAFCCKNNLSSDIKQLQLDTTLANKEQTSLRNKFAKYRNLVEMRYKKWTEKHSKTELKFLKQYINTLDLCYKQLKEKHFSNWYIDNFYEKKLKIIKNEV